jgi:hypothetical protein
LPSLPSSLSCHCSPAVPALVAVPALLAVPALVAVPALLAVPCSPCTHGCCRGLPRGGGACRGLSYVPLGSEQFL